MVESKVQVFINTSDLTCSVCHLPLYYPVALPCMHRFCEHCVFFLNECALCRKEFTPSDGVQDHFLQSIAREHIPALPLCGAGPALLYSENLEHRKNCLSCLQLLTSQQEEQIRRIKSRCYTLLGDDMESDSDNSDSGNEVVLRAIARPRR